LADFRLDQGATMGFVRAAVDRAGAWKLVFQRCTAQ
jgi:hypothetical protein